MCEGVLKHVLSALYNPGGGQHTYPASFDRALVIQADSPPLSQAGRIN